MAKAVRDVEVVKAATQMASQYDKYGRVTAGYIHFTGHLISMDARMDPRDPEYEKLPGTMPSRNLTIDYIRGKKKRHGTVWFDRQYPGPGGKLRVLRVARMYGVSVKGEKFWYPSLYYGLVLQTTGKPGEYRRIGVAENKNPGPSTEGVPLMQQTDLFASSPKQTIVLV